MAMSRDLPSICFVGLGNLPVLTPEYNQHRIGGEQVQQTLLAKSLVRRGYQVSMVVADYGQHDGQTWDGVKTYKAYDYSAGLPVIRFIYPRLTSLWAAFKRANADIYYISCASNQVGYIAQFVKMHKRQAIFRIASDSDCDPSKLLIRYRRDRKIYEYGLNRMNAILAQSEFQKKDLFHHYNLESHVATMMVDRCDEVLSFDKRDMDLLWVSNIQHLKRPDLLAELTRKMPDQQAHMVGGAMTGQESLFAQVEGYHQEIDNLHFYGQVPYHDVNGYYKRAKIFINTSDIEGFPNSYLQSWVCGTPVVAFFDPDNIIAKEGLGKAVTTIDEMIEAIDFYKNNHQAWLEVSERCKAYMAKQYNEDDIMEPYLAAISSCSNS